MKRLKDRLDPKYLKISLYVIFSAVIVFIICLILFHSKGFFGGVWRVIKAVLGPVILGGVICYLLSPISDFLVRHLNGKSEKEKGWVRPVAVVLTILFVLIIIIVLVMLLGSFIVNGLKSFSLEDIKLFLESIKNQFAQYSSGVQTSVAGLKLPFDNLENMFSGFIASIGGSIANTLASIPKAATTVLFSVIFAIYFLLDGRRIGDYLKRAIRILSSEKTRRRTKMLLEDADKVFSGYIRGKILDAFVLAIITSVAFTIAGVPYAIVTGVFIGVVIIVPYVGSVVSYLILLLAYLIEGDFSRIWVGLIILTIILVFEAYILCPKLISQSIVIHPLLIIVALIAGGAVGGLVGMLIAIPIVALIKVEFDRYLDRKEQSSRAGA